MKDTLTLDKLIVELDVGLRTLFATPHSLRPHPDADIAEATLDATEKNQVAALMRVNHTGEVCAQALYSGQALTAHSPATTAALKQAAQEETEHLAWCETRIQQLGGHTSLLNPLFYAASFSMGVVAGALGDQWNLGFLAETEKQVEAHLADHLQQLQIDEAQHADQAIQYGAAELPEAAKFLMQKVSKLMTKAAYRL